MIEQENLSLVEEKDPNTDYWVYLLIHPITDQPVYVGQSKDVMRRLAEHTANHSYANPGIGAYFNYLNKLFIFTKFKILEKCSGYNINAREKYWIKHYCDIYPDMLNVTYNSLPKEEQAAFKRQPVQYPDLSKQ